MDSPPETTHLSPVSPKTPTLLPGKSKGSKILPTTPCYPYSVQVSLLYLDFCVNWKTWETSKLIFMFSSSLIESVQEEAVILKKEVFSTLPVKSLALIRHPLFYPFSRSLNAPSSLQLQSPSSY